jgi:broad specificity phosphatase PhoE
VISNLALLDCPLSPLGQAQCLQASATANSLTSVHTVFISPLRRALETAFLLFRDHPGFSQIRFIVHPLLRENMHTVCDVPEEWEKVQEHFQKLFKGQLDVSQMGDD